MSGFLPWHLETARAWLAQRDRFAHAWLLHGEAGIGKQDFAVAAAASLLCETPQQGLACGHCIACGWFASGNHPDLRRIRPEAVALTEGAQASESDEAETAAAGSKRAPSKDIRIDQIRSLEPWFNTATHRGGWRVALLYPAQALNTIAANALLKVLEEPPAHTVFLLVSDAPDRLLPTLVSRCRRLPLAAPPAETALQWLAGQGVKQPADWLAAAGGTPLSALRLSQKQDEPCPGWLGQLLTPLAQGHRPDVGSLTETLEKVAAPEWLDALQRVFTDLMLAANGLSVRYFPALAELTAHTAARVQIARLADTAHWLVSQRAVAGHPLNPKLFIHATLQRVALALA
ncbi:MAG TPA: DNA polymerase III subunit delta' [Bordetella sp.]